MHSWQELCFIRYRQVFTPNILLLRAKVITNIGRFVVSAVYQLPAHLTFSILQTRIHTNTHPSESVFECNTEPWVWIAYDVENSLLVWTSDPLVTAVGVVSVPRLETGRLQRSHWEDWNQSLDCIRLQGLRSVGKHQHRTMQWHSMPFPTIVMVTMFVVALSLSTYVFYFRRWLWWLCCYSLHFPCNPITYNPPTTFQPSQTQSRPRFPLRHLIYWLHRRHVIRRRCSCNTSSIRPVCSSKPVWHWYLTQIYEARIALNYVVVASLGEPVTRVYNPPNNLWLDVVLLVYDTIVTLPTEMEYVWKKTLKLGTALYVLGRYPALFITVLNVLLLFSNISIRVRFFSIPKPPEWHNLNIVSSNTIFQVQFWCHVRTCNSVAHFADTLALLPIIGVQGDNDLSCQCRPVDNLRLCRSLVGPSLCCF